MKYILIMILCFCSISCFSQPQRWIKQKGTNNFIVDFTTKLPVTGTQIQMQQWIVDSISVDDSSRYTIVNNLPARYDKIIYQSDDDAPPEPIVLTDMTTNKINRIKRPKPGMMIYDRTVNKIRVYVGGVWRYLVFE